MLTKLKTSFPISDFGHDSVFNTLWNYGVKDFAAAQIPIELYEKEDHWLIKAFLPGLVKKDIHIKVKSGNVIYITAVRTKPEGLYLSELEYGEVSASVKLGALSHVKKEDIKAEYVDGILNVKVAKNPDSLPYIVEIE